MADPSDLDFGATVRSLAPGLCFFGRFTLVRPLGRGGMGVVWLAHDGKLDLDVAVKFLPEAVGADEAAVADLARETRRARELAHPHIVRVYDFHQDERLAGISMEWVDGGTLTSRRLQQPDQIFQPAQLITWVRQVCSALEYAHEDARVVHRDLKPANLMIDARDRLKITDFGISASVSESVTRVSRVASSSGSPPYMSPQQMLGGRPSLSDDIYALGATLYELLTGKPPFHTGAIGMQVQSVVPPPLADRRREFDQPVGDIPAAWEETIAACLAKNPGDRPRTAGEVAARLQGKAVTAAPDPVGDAPTIVSRASAPISEAGRGAAGAKADRVADQVDRGVSATVSAGGSRSTPAGTPAATSDLPSVSGESIPPAPSRPKRSALGWLLGGAIVAAVVAAFVFWPRQAPLDPVAGHVPVPAPLSDAQGDQRADPPTAAPVAASAPFTLTIDPPDAPNLTVWVGAHADLKPERGVVRILDVPDGEHEVVVQADGYQSIVTRVSVAPQSRAHTFKLVPQRGRLEITTSPGAVVTAVDAAGAATRLGVADAQGRLISDNVLRVGPYTARLTAEGRVAADVPVKLILGRAATIDRLLAPLPGQLRVISEPSGAEIRLGGQVVGTTPATLRDVPAESTLRLEAIRRGYRRESRDLTLKPEEVRTLNLGALVAEAGGVDIRFSNFDFGLGSARVTVDGREARPVRAGTNWRVDGLELGARTVEITHADYEPWKQSVTIRDQQNTTVTVDFMPKPATLTLAVRGPSEYELLVDGRAAEVNAGRASVPAGRELKLELRSRGFNAASRTLTAKPNGAETWTVALEKIAGPIARQRFENSLGMRFVPVAGTEAIFCVWETRVQDYEAFSRATNRGWTKSGEAAHPAVNVSWEDAQAFCRWLTERERTGGRLESGQEYRLARDWEWSVAVGLNEPRSGTPQSKNGKIDGVFPWGTQWPPPREAGNYASVLNEDSFDGTSPVGSFAANRFGIHDLGGNVWEWVEDFYDGSSGNRALRGASFGDDDARDLLLSSNRTLYTPDFRDYNVGFRVVCAAGGASLSAAAETLSGPTVGQPWTVPQLGLEMVWIKPGRFAMGSENGSGDEMPVTQVTLSKGYWLGKYEVTQAEWQALMDNNPSNFTPVGARAPVEQVAWDDAMAFCRELTERERAAGRLPADLAYTLPTEAQWEYACRAGTTGDFAGSLDAMAWYDMNSDSTTHPVGQKQANAWGLHDMHGNVWEWCANWHADNLPGGSVTDPKGATSGTYRVNRGGSWLYEASYCRSALRNWDEPSVRRINLGFRLALASSR